MSKIPPRITARGLPVLAATAAIGVWWVCVDALHISSFWLPGPPDIVNLMSPSGEESSQAQSAFSARTQQWS